MEGLKACPRCGWRGAYTVPEAAAELGVSVQTVRNWIKLGTLPGVVGEGERPDGSPVRYWVPIEVVEKKKAEIADVGDG